MFEFMLLFMSASTFFTVRGNALNRFTKSGALIQANLIPLTVLNNVSVFYVCEGCGKCYWDGTHFGRVIAGRLKNIVKN